VLPTIRVVVPVAGLESDLLSTENCNIKIIKKCGIII
jgi:hypothetical protein